MNVNAPGTQITFRPTNPLVRNTRYTVTLTGGTTAIRDVFDNPLATTSFSFRTA